jgi:hypothetical protein
MSEAPPYPTLTKELFEEVLSDLALRPGAGGKDFVIVSGRGFGKSFSSAWRAHSTEEEKPILPEHAQIIKEIIGHPFLQALKSLVPQLKEDLLWIKYKMIAGSGGLEWETELQQKIKERLSELLYDASEDEIEGFLSHIELQELSIQEIQYSDPDRSMLISKNECPSFLMNLKVQLPPIEKLDLFTTSSEPKKSRRNKRVERLAQDPSSKEQIKNMMRYAHRRK